MTPRIKKNNMAFFMIAAMLLVPFVSSDDCSPSLGNIKCECSGTTIECSGSQTGISDAEAIISNFSSVETVILKLNNLHFESTFKFENSDIKNLTLGYGLQIPSSHFFTGLGSSLVSLNLQNNSIQSIDDDLFSPLSLLTELYLDMNEIHDIKSSMFIKLTNLKYLSIKFNNINEVKPDVFQNLTSLQTLLLSHNNFSSMENINIKSASLTELSIDSCFIESSVKNDTLMNAPNIEKLDISNNKLLGINSHSLSVMKNLKYLNLSFNIIEYLEENAFYDLINLTVLDLHDNEISIVKLSSFAKLQNLRYLDLSGNKLQAVLCEYTTDLFSLEIIHLQNNEIKTFTPGTFFYSPDLKAMDITNNNLECSCPLTDSALYLVANTSIERTDLETTSCVIRSTGSQFSILDYKSSKCIPVEPCKKIEVIEEEDEDYDYDADESSSISSTITASTEITTTFANPSTEKVTDQISTTLTTTTEEISSSTSGTTETEVSTTQSSTLIENTETEVTTLMPVANEHTTLPITTTEIENIPTTEYNNVSEEVTNTNINTFSEDTDILTSTKSTFSTTTLIYSTVSESGNSSDVPSTMNSVSNDVTTVSTGTSTSSTFTSSTYTAARKTPNTVSPISNCSTLSLDTGGLKPDSGIVILKNFSHDDDSFCLKWTVGGTKGMKIRCSLKYTTRAGTKVIPLVCPSNEYEVKEWSKSEKIFKFCLTVNQDIKKKNNSCELLVSEKSSTESSSLTVTLPITKTSTANSESPETSSKESYETTNLPLVSTDTTYTQTDETTTVSTEINEERTDTEPGESRTLIPTTSKKATHTNAHKTTPSVAHSEFFINSLDLHFNDSKLAFTTWSVNKQQPYGKCNLTLKVSTQYFETIEDVFNCTNNTYRLKTVKEDDIFKICLYSHHIKDGKGFMCDHTLPFARASTSNDESSLNSSLIPLICLLVLLGLIMVFIIFKNIFKKTESKKYKVRAEEQKYNERVRLRPQSSHEESMRFSYIAKENQELI